MRTSEEGPIPVAAIDTMKQEDHGNIFEILRSWGNVESQVSAMFQRGALCGDESQPFDFVLGV